MSKEEYQEYVNKTVKHFGGTVPDQTHPKPRHAKLIDEINTPEELAGEIVENPNLWGMYSIADAIYKLIKLSQPQSPVAETEEQRIKKRRGGGEEIPKGGWRESPVWVKGKKPEGKEHEKINIKYKGSPDVLVMIDTRWCWYEKDLKTSSFFIVQEDSWSEIEWLSETPSEEQVNIQSRKEMSLEGQLLEKDFEIQRLKTIMDQAGVKYEA